MQYSEHIFSSVFTKENTDLIPDFQHVSNVNLNTDNITEEDMKVKLKSLNCNKSPGPDQINPKILYEISNELASTLKILFDKTI